MGGNVGYLETSNNSPFKNFTSSSNQITAEERVGGNVGYLLIDQETASTFQIDFVSCGNTLNSSNTEALIGGNKKKFTFLKQK